MLIKWVRCCEQTIKEQQPELFLINMLKSEIIRHVPSNVDSETIWNKPEEQTNPGVAFSSLVYKPEALIPWFHGKALKWLVLAIIRSQCWGKPLLCIGHNSRGPFWSPTGCSLVKPLEGLDQSQETLQVTCVTGCIHMLTRAIPGLAKMKASRFHPSLGVMQPGYDRCESELQRVSQVTRLLAAALYAPIYSVRTGIKVFWKRSGAFWVGVKGSKGNSVMF